MPSFAGESRAVIYTAGMTVGNKVFDLPIPSCEGFIRADDGNKGSNEDSRDQGSDAVELKPGVPGYVPGPVPGRSCDRPADIPPQRQTDGFGCLCGFPEQIQI
jgi:hypothetical protein